MPRHSRKRGKQIKKRGISKEQVCIDTATDRQGNSIMELACKGRITKIIGWAYSKCFYTLY